MFVAFVQEWLACRELPRCRSFDSAEVRFAQDDREFVDGTFPDRSLAARS